MKKAIGALLLASAGLAVFGAYAWGYGIVPATLIVSGGCALAAAVCGGVYLLTR